MTMKVFDNPQPPERAQLALILLGSLKANQEVDSQQPYIASSKFFVTSQGLKIFGPSGVITPLYIHNIYGLLLRIRVQMVISNA